MKFVKMMTSYSFHGYVLLGLLGTYLGFVQCLKDVRVSVPQAVRKGETAVFMCDFDLEGDLLYTVKWYKGRSEFFRYTPKDEFPIKIFPLEGLNIDKSKSNMTRLTIEKVQPSLSGKYNCEVSAESSFHTALVSGVMDVVDVPELDPIIEGVKRRYKVGDMLYANCTSGKSNPPANITWYINGQLASPLQVTHFPENTVGNGTMAKSKSNIQFVVTTHDFINERLVLKCSATIHNVYHRSSEISIDEEGRLNSDSPQIIVVSANFQDELDENGRKRRRYDSGSDSGSSLLTEKTLTSTLTVVLLHIYFFILKINLFPFL